MEHHRVMISLIYQLKAFFAFYDLGLMCMETQPMPLQTKTKQLQKAKVCQNQNPERSVRSQYQCVAYNTSDMGV